MATLEGLDVAWLMLFLSIPQTRAALTIYRGLTPERLVWSGSAGAIGATVWGGGAKPAKRDPSVAKRPGRGLGGGASPHTDERQVYVYV